MAQILTVSSVDETGAMWSSGANTQTSDNIWAQCDAAGSSGTSGWLKLNLSNPSNDPLDHANHTINVECHKDSGSIVTIGTAQITAELRESGVLRGTLSYTTPNDDTDTIKSYTLSTSEASNVNNYNNLQLWLKCTFTAGTEGTRIVYVDYGETSIPSLVAPGAPTGFSATDGAYSDKTRCTWSAPSHSPGSAAVTYKVYRDGSLIASGVSGTTYDDTTGTPGQVYTYKARATNGAGDSGDSNTNTGYRQVTDIFVTPSPVSAVFKTIAPTILIADAVITPAAVSMILSTFNPTVKLSSIPATWRTAFAVYNDVTGTYHLGLLSYAHATEPGEPVAGSEVSASTDHLALHVETRKLTRHRYEGTYVSSFASSALWSSSESGGSPTERPDTVVTGGWHWGAYPDLYNSPGSLINELSVPYDESEVYDTTGYPDYRASPSDPAITTRDWRGMKLVLGPSDLNQPAINKSIRRVWVWCLGSKTTGGSGAVIIEPLPAESNNYKTDVIVETFDLSTYSTVSSDGATRPVVLGFADFDPAKNPTVSGHATGEAFFVQLNLENVAGILRLVVEYDMGGDVALVHSVV